jgi:pimeloyl-ACP methyl ester carboxylesterase
MIALASAGATPTRCREQRIVNELHTLLTNARTKGPLCLVGRSFGGLAVRLYAAQYPEEVKGNDLKQVHDSPAVVKSLRACGLHVSMHS